MRNIVLPSLAALALMAACGDDDKGTDKDTTTSTTDTKVTNPPDTTSANESALTGVAKPANPKAEPTADPQCAATQGNPSYPATTGFAYPWEGATVDGKTYTCNGCKTGDSKMQGTWRVHGFAEEGGGGNMDYAFPDPATDYAEVLKVDGNTFEIHVMDKKAASGAQEGLYRGFYFCSQKPENGAAHNYWFVTEGDVGSVKAGDVFETDVVQGGQGSADNILIYWYDDVGGTTNLSVTYCKIGTKNPDNATQTCTNTIP